MALAAALAVAIRGGLTPVSKMTSSRDYSMFLEVNLIDHSSESIISWLMLNALTTMLDAAGSIPTVANDQDALGCRMVAPAGGGGQVAFHAGEGAPARPFIEDIPVGEVRAAIGDANKATYWVLDLAACHQVKPLQPRSIANYFKMTSGVAVNGRSILRIIEVAAFTLPPIVSDGELRAVIGDSTFMMYHTSYSSSASLSSEMIDSAPIVTHVLFTAATRARVQASLAAPHDRVLNGLIPVGVLLATRAYLEINSKLPDMWVQGDKAKASLPALRYDTYKSIFRRVREVSLANVALDAAATMAAVAAAIDPAIMNV